MSSTAGLHRVEPRGRSRSTHETLVYESKLTLPVHRPGRIVRAGLVNRMRVARAAAVLCVTAPSGYGKSTLVSDWARRDDRRFAWYDVDDTDDAATFVAHLATAVARVSPGTAGKLTDALAEGRGEHTLFLAAELLGEDAAPAVVVLDDVDKLADPAAVRLLEQFVEELPPGAQLVLVGRAAPPLPLARLRARGLLIEFGVDDLRYTDREAAAALRSAGARLRDEAVVSLNASVEGWPAGVYLAALTLRSLEQPDRDEVATSGAGMLFDFFRRELIANLDDDELSFLTRSSVLDRLCGPLCDAVTGLSGSSSRIERLERTNLFVVPLDREGNWYRMHSVFRTVLRAELARREPELESELLRRAAGWCGRNGRRDLALEYARSAGDVEQLIELVEQSALPFTASATPARVQQWLGAFDNERLLRRHPAAAAIGALAWAMTGRGDDADRWADAAERSRRSRSTAANPSPWRSLLHSLMSPSGADEMRKEAEQALGSLPAGSVWRVPALLVLAAAQALGGDGRGADATLRDAADVAASVGAVTLESAALGLQSLLATDRGDWAQADELAAAARKSVEQSHLDQDVTSLFAFAASARAALRRGDWAMVRTDLESADALLPRLTYALGSFSVYLRMEFARVRLALGDVDGADSLVEEIEGIFARRPRLGVFRQEVDAFKRQISEGADRAAGTSPLTAAELRLLPLLTTHLSFREIADRLYVSRNTVKTQAISVYRKLGVSSRGDAIARASDLGLIADDDDDGTGA